MKRLALIKDITDFWKIYEPMFKAHSIDVVTLDIFNYKDQQKLLNEEWDGFFWRAKHDPKFRDLAKRLIALFDIKLGIKTFPSFNDYGFYDDKMAQSFLFQKLNIPTPKTYVFYNKEEAIDFINGYLHFPLIYKASSGAGSSNVGLLKNKFQSKRYIQKAFGKGIETFFKEDLQRNYVYLQEYLKSNLGDYRIISYGKNRLLGFFRENKKNQKFASGSDKIIFDEIPTEILNLVYQTCKKLNLPNWMAFDILKDNQGQWVIGEISVINGDLNSLEIYENSPHYEVSENNFIRINNIKETLSYFIDSLLKDWGWID